MAKAKVVKTTKTAKAPVSEREKSIIVSLVKAGVETSVVAKAFGVPRQAAAAYLAWDTMRSK